MHGHKTFSELGLVDLDVPFDLGLTYDTVAAFSILAHYSAFRQC